MKNYAYQCSKMKHQLRERKERQIREVIWKLSPEQNEFINRLGYKTEPYLYEVQTKQIVIVTRSNIPKILKDINCKNRNGIKQAFFVLNKDLLAIFDDYGIKYRPYKYKIIL